MRIAQVAPLYESVPLALYGGTERVVSWLTEELVAVGHDVTLFASGESRMAARLVPCTKQSLRTDPTCCDALGHHVQRIECVAGAADEFDVIHFHVDCLTDFLRSLAVTNLPVGCGACHRRIEQDRDRLRVEVLR